MSGCAVVETHTGVGGFFKFEAVKVDENGNEISRRILLDWFPNLITNQGLDRMGANNWYLAYCHVGSGSTAPAFTDTGLVTFIAAASPLSSTTSAQATPPYYASRNIIYRFGVGVATGNISEVGIAWAASGATLFSRALVLTGGGVPTTITVLADEILDVTYSFRVYPPTVDVTGNITISGVVYAYTLRASKVTTYIGSTNYGWGVIHNVGDYTGSQSSLFGSPFQDAFDGAIGAITASPAGSSSFMDSASNAAYSASSLFRDGTITWGISKSLAGGFKSIHYQFTWGSYQIEFTPVLPKTGVNTLNLTFRNIWTRV